MEVLLMQGARALYQKLVSFHWKVYILLLVFLLCILYYFFIRNSKNPEIKGLPVVVSTTKQADVPIYVAALGTVTPIYTITIQSQINGLLMKVLFKEGELVKQGQLLAQIDQRPYEALLIQYQGDLKRDSALLENALIDLKRYQLLWKQNSVSQQVLATQQALVKQYEGNVETDQGLIQSTKVNLIYCNITAPVDGRIGLRLIDPGNFVQTTSTTGIAVITTTGPITVIFPIAEDYVPQIIPKAYASETIEVKAFNRQQTKLLASGKLLASANQIDTTTGTVKLRAIFDNKDNALFPNQFVNIKILANTLKQAILVPSSAIQHMNNGDFVFLRSTNSTVKLQPIKTGPISGNYTVIKAGLEAGQEVVIEGADKLLNGSKVIIQTTVPKKIVT